VSYKDTIDKVNEYTYTKIKQTCIDSTFVIHRIAILYKGYILNHYH